MYWTLIGSLLPFGILSIIVVFGLVTSTIVGKGQVLGALFILGIFFVSGLLGVALTLILRRRYSPSVRFLLGLVTGISMPFVISFVIRKFPTRILDGTVFRAGTETAQTQTGTSSGVPKGQVTKSVVPQDAGDFFRNPAGDWIYEYAPAESKAYKSTKVTPKKRTISISSDKIKWNGLTYFKVEPIDLSVLGNDFGERMEYREIDTRLSVKAVRFFKKENFYATIEWLVESPKKVLSQYEAALIDFDETAITISDFSNRPMATLRRK